MKKYFMVLIVCFYAFIIDAQTIWYVKPNASGNGSGTSWSNAAYDLQAVINKSNHGDHIWVGEGTYVPSMSADDNPYDIHPQNFAFRLTDGQEIYGGFPTNSILNPTWNDRSADLHHTILTGMWMSNHVVISPDGGGTLDGIIISEGNAVHDNNVILTANGKEISYNKGGGIYIDGSNLILNDVIIKNCTASYQGGGIYVCNSEQTFNRVKFESNIAGQDGGGLYYDDVPPGFQMTSCYFHNNTAINGAGIFSYRSPTYIAGTEFMYNTSTQNGAALYVEGSDCYLDYVEIKKNIAQNDGGGIYVEDVYLYSMGSRLLENKAINNGGGIYCNNSSYYIDRNYINFDSAKCGGGIYVNETRDYSFHKIIFNSVICDNYADSMGGGMYFREAFPEIINVTMANNMAKIGNSIYNESSHPFIENSIIWNYQEDLFENLPTIVNDANSEITFSYHSLITRVTDDDSYPSFYNIDAKDYRLSPYSMCIDAGTNYYVDYCGIETDILGAQRIANDVVDMGAYEYGGIYHAQSLINLNEIQKNLTNTDFGFLIFPNPADNNQQINISLEKYDKSVDVKMYSLDGKLIHSKNYSGNNFSLSVPDLAPGMYMINVQTQEGGSFIKKIVVTK